MEYRIYHKGKLVNVCTNEFITVCNLTTYRAKYGKDNITVKVMESPTMDEEKREWLDNLLGGKL